MEIKFLQKKHWLFWAIVAIVVVLGGLATYIYSVEQEDPVNTTLMEDVLGDCQPEFFDPKTAKFKKVPTNANPPELYKIEGTNEYIDMMINGWKKEGENKIYLTPPFDITTYEFGCASTESFVADITKNGIRQSLITHINNYLTQNSVSQDKKSIFIVNNVKDEKGEWILHRKIMNIENNTKVELPNMECVSDYGFWNGNKIITHSDFNNDYNNPNYQTKICIWNQEGKLLNQVATELSWIAGAGWYLYAQIGLLPKDDNIFYAYNYRTMLADRGVCYVNLFDLNDQNKNKKIKIADADKNGSCSYIKMDLSNVTFDSSTIPYQLTK
jgi:hypothetical protein